MSGIWHTCPEWTKEANRTYASRSEGDMSCMYVQLYVCMYKQSAGHNEMVGIMSCYSGSQTGIVEVEDSRDEDEYTSDDQD